MDTADQPPSLPKAEVKPETVKRLAPTQDVLRELFLKSGNLCAFPGCNRPIMDQKGRFVGQLCHIEAAEKGGERFNETMTNEGRRAFSNLLLLCYEHHVVTNNLVDWTVPRMQEIKVSHEKKVFDFIENLQMRIVDFTALTEAKPTVTLARLAKLQKWNLTGDEVALSAEDLNALLERLRKIPSPARELLSVIVSKAGTAGIDRNHVSLHELRLACALEQEILSELCQILDKYGFICDAGYDDYGHSRIFLFDLGSGWRVWDDFRIFADAGHATLHELIVELNFSLLDDPTQTESASYRDACCSDSLRISN